MQDTMCLGKFFTRAVTACSGREQDPQHRRQGLRPPSAPGLGGCHAYFEDFHLEPTVGRGPVWYLQGLHEGLGELLHHREDQGLGCTLTSESRVSTRHPGPGSAHAVPRDPALHSPRLRPGTGRQYVPAAPHYGFSAVTREQLFQLL